MKHESDVLNTVADHYGLTVKDILSVRRNRELVDARLSAYLAYRLLGWTTTRIGKTFGRDHSTVVVAVQNASDDDWALAEKLTDMATSRSTFHLRRDDVDGVCTYVIRNPRTEEEVVLPSVLSPHLAEMLTYVND